MRLTARMWHLATRSNSRGSGVGMKMSEFLFLGVCLSVALVENVVLGWADGRSSYHGELVVLVVLVLVLYSVEICQQFQLVLC